MADGFHYDGYHFMIHVGQYRLDLMAGPGASSNTASTGEISPERWEELNFFSPDVELQLFELEDGDLKHVAIPSLKDRRIPVTPNQTGFIYGFCTPQDVADALQYAANLAKRGGG